MNERLLSKMASISALINSFDQAGKPLLDYLGQRRERLVEDLVAREDAITRGRIQEIDILLGLRKTLERERDALDSPLPRPGGLDW
jgi:hypothetical protein